MGGTILAFALRLLAAAFRVLLVLVLGIAVALVAVCQPWPAPAGSQPYLSAVSPGDRDLEARVDRRVRSLTPGTAPDPPPPTGLWQLRAVRAQEAWQAIEERREATGNREPVRIGIYDGFMAGSHPDLAPNMLEAPAEDWATLTFARVFSLSHGTGVMGIVGAAGAPGMTGVAPRSRLLSFSTLTRARRADMADALGFFVERGARVANFAIAVPSPLTTQDVVDSAYQQGLLVVTGLPNSDTDGIAYPAGHEKVLVASGSDPEDRTMGYGWGPLVDIVAPGTGILTTAPVARAGPLMFGRRYAPLCCNSAAASIVTGIAALVLEHDPSLSSAQVEKRIKLSARKPQEMLDGRRLPLRWHPRYGYGVADAYAAVTYDRAGPQVTLNGAGFSPDGTLARVTGTARDADDDAQLDPDRPRDRHLLGVPVSNVKRVEFSVDDGPWQPASPTNNQQGPKAQYPFNFLLHDLPPGDHRVQVRAYDTAGNRGPEALLPVPASGLQQP